MLHYGTEVLSDHAIEDLLDRIPARNAACLVEPTPF
jgi:hypothetical protein